MRFTEKNSQVGIRCSNSGHVVLDLLHESEPASEEFGVSGEHVRTLRGHFMVV